MATAPVVSRDRQVLTLHELNLTLEQLCVLWRIIHGRQFISQQQLLFAITQIDEIGRVTGGWIKRLDVRVAPRQ